MQTFIARFVRPNGDRGELFVFAASAGLAVLDVMHQQGPVSQVSVTPRRCAALLTAQPWIPGRVAPKPGR
jgi:hypothetical protein